MKKRSMLALASLATGFVVAAVSPSHAEDHTVLDDLNVRDTVSTLDQTVSQDSFAESENALGRNN
ncbi:hypothetical protein ACIQOU_01790 [Streptomyces sp. NPDC091279]|uniref:hypothetical protein n=1 Tax=unclassified Streptomyces TaxID=2593676 RepID=UPI0037FCD71E